MLQLLSDEQKVLKIIIPSRASLPSNLQMDARKALFLLLKMHPANWDGQRRVQYTDLRVRLHTQNSRRGLDVHLVIAKVLGHTPKEHNRQCNI